MVKLLNRNDEVIDAGAVGAFLPLAVIADAVDLLVEADGAALRHAGRRGSPDAASEHTHPIGAIILGGALVELVKVDGMLEGAVLDQTALGDVAVVLG